MSATAIAPKVKGSKVIWHPRAEQFYVIVGYHKGRSGRPSRTYHYLTDNKSYAEHQAEKVQTAWEKVKGPATMQAALSSQLMGKAIKAEPLWPKTEKERQELIDGTTATKLYPNADTKKQVEAKMGVDGDDDLDGTLSPDYLSIERAKEYYLAYKKSTINLPRKGINASTYRHIEWQLNFALKVQGADGKPILDPSLDLSRINYPVLERFVHRWMQLVGEGKYSLRTAADACLGVKHMLDRCDRDPMVVYRHPLDIGNLFSFPDANPTTSAKGYNAKELISIFDKLKVVEGDNKQKVETKERVRCYCLMAINLGYYQLDIARLTPEMVSVDEQGDMFITRKRERTKHKVKFETTAYVWPETRALMEKYKAPAANVHGLWFLNRAASPLQTDDSNTDNIATEYGRLVRDKGVKFMFKAFRKVGNSWIANNVSDLASRQYRAEAPQGTHRFYHKYDVETLTNALKKFREQFIADKVLVTTT